MKALLMRTNKKGARNEFTFEEYLKRKERWLGRVLRLNRYGINAFPFKGYAYERFNLLCELIASINTQTCIPQWCGRIYGFSIDVVVASCDLERDVALLWLAVI